MMTASVKVPAKSGFCNPSNPPDSHARCNKADCPCTCGLGCHQSEPITWEGDNA